MTSEEAMNLLFQKHFAKHFVSLCMGYTRIDSNGIAVSENGVPDQTPTFKAYSGFLASFRGMWCVMTAGHIMNQIMAVAESENGFVNTLLLGFGFGEPLLQTVEFPVHTTEIMTAWRDCEDEGFDFAVIAIPPNIRRQLESSGHLAIAEKDWRKLPSIKMDKHVMIGLPEEFVCQKLGIDVNGRLTLCSVDPVVMTVEACDIPEDKNQDLLCFKIGFPDRIKSIVGMSGGPIIGYRICEEGIRYWVVGVQGWWNKSTRVAFGTRLERCAARFEQHLAAISYEYETGRRDQHVPGFVFSQTDSGVLIAEPE